MGTDADFVPFNYSYNKKVLANIGKRHLHNKYQLEDLETR
jgi:hypothetical protein